MNRIRVAVTLIAASALAVSGGIVAGDLEPPGPPAPTMKTLDEVEPRTPIHAADFPLTISGSGSFYLAENVSTGGTGIHITASHVTLDLMGFTLRGGSGDGIRTTGAVSGIEVRNGVVAGWSSDGIDLQDAPNSRIVGIRVEGNGLQGIRLGDNSSVVDCVARDNAFFGIISTGDNSSIRGSTGENNGQCGVAASNTSFGVTIANSLGRGNGVCGIQGGFGTLITDSTATTNTRDGIATGTGSSVINSNAVQNGNDGIATVGSGGSVVSVRGCSVTNNTGNGIAATTSWYVRDNNVFLNGANGIFVSSIGAGNRIESNQVNNNGSDGIRVAGAANLIVKNRARGNAGANYSIDPGNDLGTIAPSAAGAGAWDNFE